MVQANQGRNSPCLFTITFRKMIDMHLLCVSGADNETECDSMPVTTLQRSSTISRLTSQDPLGLSDLADTSIVGISSLDNAPRNSESCKPQLMFSTQYP